MLGKIVNNQLVVAGRIVKDGNTTITNPTEEKLKELGYLPVVYEDKPTYNKEEEKLQETYTETYRYETKAIVVDYEVVALTTEEHNAIIQQEIVAEENKITPRNIRNAIKGDNFALNKITEVEGNIAKLRAKIREITSKEEE